MVPGRERFHVIAGRRRDGRGLHDAGAHGDDELLGARLERVRHVRFVDGDRDGERAAPGRHRAVHHASAAGPDDQFGPDRNARLRRERHLAIELSVVRRSKRRDFVARRRRDIAELHDAGAHGYDQLLGARHQPVRRRELEHGDSDRRRRHVESIRRRSVLVLVNQRRAAGATCGGTVYPPAGPLTMNANLQLAARLHSQDMATQNYFSHTSLDGRTFDQRIRNAGYSGSFPLGENLAAGVPNPQSLVDGWMNSPGHCANIMNGGYRSTGVGYAFSSSSTYRHYWTQTFGGS